MKREEVMASRQLAGRVTRWHTWPMIRKPSVAEHSSRVATLYVELWGMPRAEVLYYCLLHDHGEFTAGDTPFSAKSLAPGLREGLNVAETEGLRRLGLELPALSEREFLQFKVCDLLEMFETGVVEWNMGNRYAGCVVADCAREARNVAHKLDLHVGNNYADSPTHAKNFNWIHNWICNNGYEGERSYVD